MCSAWTNRTAWSAACYGESFQDATIITAEFRFSGLICVPEQTRQVSKSLTPSTVWHFKYPPINKCHMIGAAQDFWQSGGVCHCAGLCSLRDTDRCDQ